MAVPEEVPGPVIAFDLNAATRDAIGACNGDLVATVRPPSSSYFLIAQNQSLSAELEHVWSLVSPGFSRSERTRRRSTGVD